MANVSELWVDAYAPRDVNEMVANRDATRKVINWLNTWNGLDVADARRRPLLLCGPPGVGKTTTIRIAANAAGYSVVELNASDKRSASALAALEDEFGVHPGGLTPKALTFGGRNKREGEAAAQPRTLLVLEEADGLDGNADRGGVRTMTTLARSGSVPVIFTANLEASNPDLRPIVTACGGKDHVLRFAKFTEHQLVSHLNRVICLATKTLPDAIVVQRLSRAADGDARHAVNEAQMIYSHGGARGAIKATEPRKEDSEAVRAASDSIFERGRRLFMVEGTMEQRLQEAREDEYLTHSFVFGNYLGKPLTQLKMAHFAKKPVVGLRHVHKISELFSLGDVFDRELRVKHQHDPSLEDIDLLLRTVSPALLCGLPLSRSQTNPVRPDRESSFPSEVLSGNSQWLAAVRTEHALHNASAGATRFAGLDSPTCALLYQRVRALVAAGQQHLAIANILVPYGIGPDLWDRFKRAALWSNGAGGRIPEKLERELCSTLEGTWELLTGEQGGRRGGAAAKREGDDEEEDEGNEPNAVDDGVAQTSLAKILVKRKRTERRPTIDD